MLLTERKEIDIFLPTSVQESAQSILTLAADAEETYLLPVLGRPLFNRVNEIYQDIALDDQWLLPQNGAEAPIEQKLVRICQEVVVYMTLANNAGLFSVSMNDAGLNTPSAAGYEEADDKRIDRFVKDAWKKGHRAIDRLLLFLEEDATSEEPQFSDLWKQSKWFYRNNDTLFSTAVEFDRYVSIDESREWFVKLLPDIRFCQDTFLCPQVGYGLMDALIESLSSPTQLAKEQQRVWQTAINKLRQSLALYAENRNEKLRRKNSRAEADLSLERAKEYIRYNQAVFGEAMKGSPLYDASVMEKDAPTDTEPSDNRKEYVMNYDPDAEDNAAHALFHFSRIL